ncbi:MAG: rod shape-determining protein MreD [Bacteroidetes bacterium]|jgi:rod shape-determining protein MreD|nr:rod shape-determining protein MreD [Bacteroidota bacterium]
MTPHVRYAIIAFVLFLVQMTFVPLIPVAGFTPDLLILWLVAVGVRRGRLEATLGGFLIGLLHDLTATQFLGLAALAKSITGFVAGSFYNENTAEQTLGSYRSVLIALFLSVLHNFLYYAILFQGVERSVLLATLVSTLGTSLYTTVVAILPMFWFSRRFRTEWAR